MKKLTLILFFFVSFLCKAQGNLQFNQALLLSATANNSTQWTVPAGKVWKLESMGVNASAVYVYFNGTMAFEYWGATGSTGNNGYARSADSSPLWLPAGTVVGHYSNATTAYRWFSILEFNIVP
ncbi:MAG: hypothetical protein ACK444_07495 [Flavobacteriales bacterium]|jgi:hypothetical protein